MIKKIIVASILALGLIGCSSGGDDSEVVNNYYTTATSSESNSSSSTDTVVEDEGGIKIVNENGDYKVDVGWNTFKVIANGNCTYQISIPIVVTSVYMYDFNLATIKYKVIVDALPGNTISDEYYKVKVKDNYYIDVYSNDVATLNIYTSCYIKEVD